jgi:hypothetical protein
MPAGRPDPLTLPLPGGSVSGKQTINTTNPMVYPNCSYDITLTKNGA